MGDTWIPVGFDSFESVPLHHRPLERADREIRALFNDREGLIAYHKPSTDQWWIVVGKEDGRCPVERCGAQCCKTGSPWPGGDASVPCMFLTEDDQCRIQQSKLVCCLTAPSPWNDMRQYDRCELRCVEVTRGD